MLTRIRALVCEDEPDAREGLVGQLRRDPDVVVVGTAGDGLESLEAITSLAPDLVFLDIHMPLLNGVEVIARVGQRETPVVVFVTAHAKYAIQAFDVHAQDYLLKPFSDARFSDMLARAKATVRQRQARALSETLRTMLPGPKT